MSASLVGSEMCIRDRPCHRPNHKPTGPVAAHAGAQGLVGLCRSRAAVAVSYTHLTLPTICSV
eukprot:5307970-Alexandrium_andersonii.AAC.1